MKLSYQRVNFLLATVLLAAITLASGCASHKSPPNGPGGGEADQRAQEKKEMEERIIGSPMLITSDYFRKTAGEEKPLRLFGSDPKKEKELEERLARLEERLKGLPHRAKDANGMPVLRRKVVLLSLLGDLGLDVLSVLPAALRRTDGIVPVPSSRLATLLAQKGLQVSDLASVSVRREIAAAAGIHAYLLIYFAQGSPGGKASTLRIDAIHAQESVLIGSYLATIDEFDKIAPKISEDIVQGTEWSCRVVSTKGGRVYLNAGRLTGLQPGDVLKVYARGKELIDPVTRRSLGFAPGEMKGEVRIENLFGTDASEALIISGEGMVQGDIAKMARLS